MDRDADLYKRYIEGDESAFNSLMESLFYRLVYFVDRIIEDTFTAEDIAVDVFAELVANKKRYNFKTSLKTYVFVLGKRRALNFLKHRKVLEIKELSEAEKLIDERNELEAKVLKSERDRILSDALNKIEPEMKQVLHLVYFEELSYKQAAYILDKDSKYVDNLLQRAKKELRKIIGEERKELL